MLTVAKTFNIEFLELRLLTHKLTRMNMEKKLDKPVSNDATNGFVVVERASEDDNENGPLLADRPTSSSSSSTSSLDQSPPTCNHQPQPGTAGIRRSSSSSSPSLDEFCRSFEQAMTIARHAERAKAQARNALDRAETARCLAEQAWEQAMSAAEAAQSIARSGLAVARLSLEACQPRSKPNQPIATLKTAYELFASQREPTMDYERFKQALCFDSNDQAISDEILDYDLEDSYPCNALNCQTCHSRRLAQGWRFFKAPEESTPPPPPPPPAHKVKQKIRLEESLRHLKKKKEGKAQAEDKSPKPARVPKCFEKYSSPLGQFSGATQFSCIPTQTPNEPCSGQGRVVCDVAIGTSNELTERGIPVQVPPLCARQSPSDELEYLTFWPQYETADTCQDGRTDTYRVDDGANSDESSNSTPVFWGVRPRRAGSSDDGGGRTGGGGWRSPPLKPRQLQRLSDMEPAADEAVRVRLSAAVARRSQSCSSEPGATTGADQGRTRPCSPLVVPEVESGTSVQLLPNNVQAFQPPLAKSTTPPTSQHGNVTSPGRAYLSD